MRNHMTEEEHIKLVEVGDEFWEKLGRAAAEAIAQFPEEIDHLITAYLQDKCSIYGTRYNEYLTELRRHEDG